MISTVVSTIGAPFLLDCLRTLPDLGETIVVVDRAGRSLSSLDVEYPLEKLEADVARLSNPPQLAIYDPKPGAWAVQNGCYNFGARLALHPFLLFTHDDVEWPAYDFRHALRRTTQWIDHWCRRRFWAPEGGDIVGAILPEWEVANEVRVPAFDLGREVVCQAVSPVSQVLSRAAFDAMGGFDEDYGVWYDGQLEHETRIRNWWYVCLPTPTLRHQSNRTYRLNNWGNSWSPNPKWGRYQENFERKYGTPPAGRKLSEFDPTELDLRIAT